MKTAAGSQVHTKCSKNKLFWVFFVTINKKQEYIYIYTLHGNKVLTHLSIMSQKKSKKNFILKKHNNNANHNDDKNDKTDAVISFK